MTDVHIRNVPEDLRQIDENAARLGLSRNDYLKRQIAQDAARQMPDVRLSRGDFANFAVLAADLTDDDVMRDAWS